LAIGDGGGGGGGGTRVGMGDVLTGAISFILKRESSLSRRLELESREKAWTMRRILSPSKFRLINDIFSRASIFPTTPVNASLTLRVNWASLTRNAFLIQKNWTRMIPIREIQIPVINKDRMRLFMMQK